MTRIGWPGVRSRLDDLLERVKIDRKPHTHFHYHAGIRHAHEHTHEGGYEHAHSSATDTRAHE